MPNHVIWTDIPVNNLDRAISFYSAVLGVEVQKEEYPDATVGVLPHDEGDVAACLVVTDENAPSENGPLVYLSVNGRLDEAESQVKSNGGKVLKPKHQIGQWGYRSVILDCEGNRIALHSV